MVPLRHLVHSLSLGFVLVAWNLASGLAPASTASAATLTSTVGSVFPSVATSGGPAFVLTVNGTGFLTSSTVFWGSTPLSTTYGSATRLTATVPASQLAAIGTPQVYVTTLGSASNSLTFTVRVLQNGATINTIAGGGPVCTQATDTYGDGCPATQATLVYVTATVVDGAGNLYIADAYLNQVRKVDPSGKIKAFAGSASGYASFSGDGGAVANSLLHAPSGLALDALGNLYIADTFNNRIRVVSPGGTITTFAGTGARGAGGDGGAPMSATFNSPSQLTMDSFGALYVTDAGNQRIRKIAGGLITTVAGSIKGFLGDGGPAISARLDTPEGIAVDGAGNLYIADSSNGRIRKVDTTGTITTIAGTGDFGFAGDGGPAKSAVLYQPYGVAIDQSGNVFIADMGNSRVRMINPTGTMSTLAGISGYGPAAGDRGPASTAFLASPIDLAVDPTGNLLIEGQNSIRKVTFSATFTAPYITGFSPATVTSGGLGFTLTINGQNFAPGAVAYWNVPTTTPTPSGGYSYGASTTALATTSVNATQVTAVVPAGLLPLLTPSGSRPYQVGVTVSTPSGGLSAAAAFKVNEPQYSLYHTAPQFAVAGGAAFTLTVNGCCFYAPLPTLYWGSTALATTLTNGGLTAIVPASLIATAAVAEIYATNASGPSNVIPFSVIPASLTSPGTISTYAGNGIAGYVGDGGTAPAANISPGSGITFDAAGNLYFGDGNGNGTLIRKVTPGGIISTFAGTRTAGFAGDGGPLASAQFKGIQDLAFDQGGNLFVLDSGNQRVRMITPSGVLKTVAGGGSSICAEATDFVGDGCQATNLSLPSPRALALDGVGNLFIRDDVLCVVRKVTLATGVITNYAGTITGDFQTPCGFSGDGGMATSGKFGAGGNMVFDAGGNLYLADPTNQRVRKVAPSGTLSTVAGGAPLNWVASPYLADYFAVSGDGGPATDAMLSGPWALSVDTSGNLFISDTYANNVRKMNASGILTTVAGNGIKGYFGDGGAATSAEVNLAGAITNDVQGNLYLADLFNNRIRKVTFASATPQAATPTFTPVAGSYNVPQPMPVTITDATPGGTIYYTTDGSLPTTSSSRYTGALLLASSGVVRAIAVAPNTIQSPTASATYTITLTANAPVITPLTGTYTAGQMVSTTDATAGATIYYTTNGSTPTTSSTKYTGPFLAASTETVQALAAATGFVNSQVTTTNYTMIGSPAAFALPATGVTATSATLSALVNPLGLAGSFSFTYGTSASALTSRTPAVAVSATSGNMSVSGSVSGLKTKTTYFYQAVVTTSGGSAIGSVLSFTTN